MASGAAVYSVPNISVGGTNVGFGAGFAQGDFIQKNYHWRDVLTHVQGAHTLKFGYEGWYGTDIEPFEGPYSTPSFNFQDLTTLIQDQPRNEGNVMYNPVTGLPQLWSWDAVSRTWGVFAMDTWKVKSNLTLRWVFATMIPVTRGLTVPRPCSGTSTLDPGPRWTNRLQMASRSRLTTL